MRLIDADKLSIVIHDSIPAMYEEAREMKEDILCEMSNTPTVDAVAVTRCKDCARYRLGLNGGPENWCGRTGFVRRDDDFCSYGEPKEDEHATD